MKQFSMPNGVGGSKWRCCAEIEASRSSGLRPCREATMKNLRVGFFWCPFDSSCDFTSTQTV